MGNERRKISLNAGAAMTLFAYDPKDGSGAYTWPHEDPLFSATAGVKFSNLHIFSWEQFGQGVSLAFNVRSRFPLLNDPFRYEAVFQAAFEPYLPLQLTLYGILDNNGINLYGTSSTFSSTTFDRITPTEYSAGNIRGLTWLGGGEAEFKLFSLNIQDNFSHIFFNRIFGTLAYRGALYDSQNISSPQGNVIGNTPYRLTQSLVLRSGGTLSTILVTALPVRISPYLWGAWKISSLQDGKLNNDFVFGFNISIEM
jgi:hypothetical protein